MDSVCHGITLLLLFDASYALQRPSIPFTNTSTANDWMNAYIEEYTDYMNGLLEWNDVFLDLIHPACKYVVDGMTMNHLVAKARSEFIRRKTSLFGPLTCVLAMNDTSFPSKYLQRSCCAKVKIAVPVYGDVALSMNTNGTLHFDDDGYLVRIEGNSKQGAFGKIMADLFTPSHANAAAPVVKIGGVEFDRIDLIVLSLLSLVGILVIVLVYKIYAIRNMHNYKHIQHLNSLEINIRKNS